MEDASLPTLNSQGPAEQAQTNSSTQSTADFSLDQPLAFEELGSRSGEQEKLLEKGFERLEINDQESLSSTEGRPKTSPFLTFVNIVKAFVGLGILAAPHGFMECGVLLSLIIFVLMGIANTYTINLQQKSAEKFGGRIRSYTDLATKVYGESGRLVMMNIIIFAQVLTCSSYIMFFQKQVNQVILQVHMSQSVYWDKHSPFVLYLSIAILMPISLLQSMKHVSYVSGIAIISILTALGFILTANVHVIETLGREGVSKMKIWDASYLPFFMGTAAFMFEGNAVMLEVHHESEDPKKNFRPTLQKAMTFTVFLICLIGILSYGAYEDKTQQIVLMNLDPGVLSWTVQLFYAVGLLCTFLLQMTPVFVLLQKNQMLKSVFQTGLGLDYRMQVVFIRLGLTMMCCFIAYSIPNLGQFINFQGAFTGSLLTFIFPCLFYLKAYEGELSKSEVYKIRAFVLFFALISSVSAYTGLVEMFKPVSQHHVNDAHLVA